ncbi:DoxX family protein [Xylanimonas cellulosilytica DSM 15894]|uniref:DoxX family protein n=1 Tax=Xylanimonas cellulosilytica (strain DSM 15894 / JCM 12276 / CECT 5975 / KCTC 9989 / LMG 20990 / NBRC 107835 / XIL07) TaxID=446471 RepID=D1BUI7_XYLCX|nr:DoxX family membrane protein [Xylanimonas cellulosilytica]ACZ29228.1 DoxX family protein [Xylanimonas cellulosilytica DSM 15894]
MSAVTERREGALPTTTVPTVGRYAFAALRVVLAFEFLWAFLDKTFGFGMATPSERAWVNGGSPTSGFLGGVEGPFQGFFNGMSGSVLADVLFMVGLLGIGVALLLGIGMRIAAVSGFVLMILMWAASLPLTNNPIFDEHWIEALVILGLGFTTVGTAWSLSKRWGELDLVRRNPWLR